MVYVKVLIWPNRLINIGPLKCSASTLNLTKDEKCQRKAKQNNETR